MMVYREEDRSPTTIPPLLSKKNQPYCKNLLKNVTYNMFSFGV